MRRIDFITVCVLYISAALALFTSCQREVHTGLDDVLSQSRPQQVGFYAGKGVQTRTEMLENGLSATWVADDVLALWAVNPSGSYALSNQKFYTYAADLQQGFFTADLSSPMADDTYTYYCTYPAPSSVSGTKATFVIPSVQDGKASKGADIMIATPVQHGALVPVPDTLDHSGMKMQMNRMMHQFRFYIPSDDTVVGSQKLERIVLTFPSGVTGNVTLDLTDPDAAPVLTDSKSMIELKLAEPLGRSGSEPQYACVAFCPKQFAEGEMLQIKAYTDSKIAYLDPIDLRGRNFLAGHSTPVRLSVNEIRDYPYWLRFNISQNNLGENINTITLTAPEGCDWDGTGSNVYTFTPGYKFGVNQSINLRFEDKEQYRKFSQQTIQVTYDSDNAITRQTVRMADLTYVDSYTTYLQIPYLFYEDFSGIPNFSDGHDSPGIGAHSDTYKGIKELSSYTSAMSGWYASRIGGQAGTSIRICCRYEDGMGISCYYKGRVYTPFLSNIKDDRVVKISVSFRYGSTIKEADYFWSRPPKENPLLFFGINTEEAVTNPDNNEGGIIEDIAGMIGGTGYSSWTDSSLNPRPISGEALPISGGSYTSFNGTRNVIINGVDNGMRLGWIVSTHNTEDSTNGNYWLYLDDIKVQIAN